MRLRSLALNQFKKFTTPMRLDGIGEGLNVLVGPNEMGKSTLLDALRAVLFEKYSSKAQPIIALQNDRNHAGPVVELTFELDGGQYRITKRFIKRPYARLSCPDGRALEGDTAEEALRDLLGIEEAGKGGAKAETLGMWNVLWVRQGQSFGDFDLPESARSNLHSALESEVGAVLGGRRGRALPEAIDQQLRELVTSNGKPRGKYKELIERADALAQELDGLRERRRELSDTLDQLEEAQQSFARLEAGERDEADQKQLDEARQRHSRLSELEARIEAATTDLELRKHTLEQAQQAAEQRRRLKCDIAAQEGTLEEARKRQEEAREQETKARSHLEASRNAVREAEAAVTRADDAVSLQSRILGAVQTYAKIKELWNRCEKAQAAEMRVRQARQSAAGIPVTNDVIERLRSAAKSLDIITSRLRAAATVVTFDIPSDRLSGIEIGGKPVAPQQRSVAVVAPTTIAIPERGRITIEPAIKDRDDLLDQRRRAKAKLKSELEAASAASLNDAEDQYAKRQKQLQVAELAQREAELFAPATDDHEAGPAALADYIEGLCRILAREKEELHLKELPPRQEAEDALRNARDDAETARHAMQRSRAALVGPENVIIDLQTKLGTVKARYEDGTERLENLRGQLAKAEEGFPETELQARIETARSGFFEQERALADLNRQRTSETLLQLEARIGQLEQAIKDKRDKRQNLNVKIAEFRSRVEALEGAGLDEAIERKERELEFLGHERSRFEREVQVLTLLLSTLRAAEQEAKERYLSPVLNRVRPYLQLLFPGADIAIDEDLRITGIVRKSGYEEDFRRLSMGTQEQIAVLVRLAFAEMLVEQGHPATVVLDDALVFSDDRRMRRMFNILNMAARKVQVIILTCREQLFEELKGRQLSLQPATAEELVSA